MLKRWQAIAVGVAMLLLIVVLKVFASRQAIERRHLAENRAKWDVRGIDDYRFTLTSSFGIGGNARIAAVAVNDGRVVSFELRDGKPSPSLSECAAPFVTSEVARPCNTIPDMFARIADMIEDPRYRITVWYQSEFGYPMAIVHDFPNAHDEEFSVRISDFEELR